MPRSPQSSQTEPPSSPSPRTPRRVRGESEGTVWERYRRNVARHLIGIARDLQQRVLDGLREDFGHEGLRPSLGPLISLVAIEPSPQSVLAQHLSISPQACGQLVDLAEKAGYLHRRSDDSDGRARVVCLTCKGETLIKNATRLLRETADRYRNQLGARALNRLTRALGELFTGLALGGGLQERFRMSPNAALGVLPLLSVHAQRELMNATSARGHDGLKMSHAQVLPLLGPEGARIATLARIQGVSRQAVAATARDLEKRGYLARYPDPQDGRGVVYRLTTTGEELIEDSVAAVDELENRFLAVMSERSLRHLEQGLEQLYDALELEQEIFDRTSSRTTTPDTRNVQVSTSAARRTARSSGSPGSAREGTLRRLAEQLRIDLGESDARRLAGFLNGTTQT